MDFLHAVGVHKNPLTGTAQKLAGLHNVLRKPAQFFFCYACEGDISEADLVSPLNQPRVGSHGFSQRRYRLIPTPDNHRVGDSRQLRDVYNVLGGIVKHIDILRQKRRGLYELHQQTHGETAFLMGQL